MPTSLLVIAVLAVAAPLVWLLLRNRQDRVAQAGHESSDGTTPFWVTSSGSDSTGGDDCSDGGSDGGGGCDGGGDGGGGGD